MQNVQCPVCKNQSGGTCTRQQINFDGGSFSCTVCGYFKASGTVLDDTLYQDRKNFSQIKRSALSHFIRKNQDPRERQGPFITTDWLDKFLENGQLPTPSQQATNLIKFIGEKVSETGVPLDQLPVYTVAEAGSPNKRFVHSIAEQLMGLGLVSGKIANTLNDVAILQVSLTLAGWNKYEDEKAGKISGNYGFLAMKFQDDELEAFASTVIKPAVAKLGKTLVDLRDVARSGIIDNILRDQIRDSAFVIVDLTHDNAGAYWEAGYAEGLGKPVLYICKQEKFETYKTHFDTNHCTTVMWGGSMSNEEFEKQLLATLRNSLRELPR